jgi:NAD(P)-dependent dehydrogenase (short-subunit alcohol dehydrogenase family)
MSNPQLNNNLSGKLAVVTGASSGIGKEIARGLARQGAEVILACRNLMKAESAKQELLVDAPKAKISVMQVDLSRLASIRAFAKAFSDKYPQLDILVNNAGGWTTDRENSPDGIELTWMTNVVGPNLLTQLLIPAMTARGRARIINVSSTVASGLDLNDIEFKSRKYSGVTAYSQTKQANRMLTWAMADQLSGSGVAVNAMSPGLVKTSLNRNAKGFVGFMFGLMVPMMGKPPAVGADTAVWLASSPEVEGVTGKFYEKRKEVPCKYRNDKGAINHLSAICDQMAGVKQSVPA